MSNLQHEIRGAMVEVAGRRGSVAGKSETYRKYLHPRAKSLFSPHVQKTLSFESYLPPSFIFMQCAVLLSCRPVVVGFFLLNNRPLLNEPEVHFALVIAVFINYRL